MIAVPVHTVVHTVWGGLGCGQAVVLAAVPAAVAALGAASGAIESLADVGLVVAAVIGVTVWGLALLVTAASDVAHVAHPHGLHRPQQTGRPSTPPRGPGRT